MRLFKVNQNLSLVNTFGVTSDQAMPQAKTSRVNAAASASTMCAAPDRQETQRRARPLWTKLRTTAGMGYSTRPEVRGAERAWQGARRRAGHADDGDRSERGRPSAYPEFLDCRSNFRATAGGVVADVKLSLFRSQVGACG
jgi:hypothetical protein